MEIVLIPPSGGVIPPEKAAHMAISAFVMSVRELKIRNAIKSLLRVLMVILLE